MNNVRTRYAPSPTGYLHVGGLRTALYNYLFARQQGGSIVLRIEDTDQTRKVEGAVGNFLELFRWLGITFDEGPGIGGPFGPYVQSERLELYRRYIDKLSDANLAYPCFCSQETLDRMREEQSALKRTPMYDRRCRSISKEQAVQRIEQGEPHVWRMKIPDGETVEVHDLIRGNVAFDTGAIDDQVLLKSDGFPTYHLANVVDDHLMEINHVIRGEEWLTSTPKHVLLYRFLGWEPPVFAHLPLLLNKDRSKMSKRSGDVSVEAYREKGILPEALLNYTALLGWHPSGDRELFTLEELVREFSFDRVSKAGAVFDPVKLRWMNSEYLKEKSPAELHQLVTEASPELKELSRDRLLWAIASFGGGVESGKELADKIKAIYDPVPDDEALNPDLSDDRARKTLDFVSDRLLSLPESVWEDFGNLEKEFKAIASEAGKANGLKGKDLWEPLRIALTGREHGPELGKLIGAWGRERVLSTLRKSLNGTAAASS